MKNLLKKLRELRKKGNIKIFNFFLIIGILFISGFFFGIRSWDGVIFVTLDNLENRNIASTDSVQDILSLSPNALHSKSYQNLFKNAKAHPAEGDIQFYLGSFLIPNTDKNNYQYICQDHSFVELTFVSSFVALSGHKGKFVMQAPCGSENEDLIGPFKIPSKRILANPSQNTFSDESSQTFIRFYETAIFLMKSWHLVRARFFNNEEEDGFIVRWQPDEETHFRIQF